MTATATAATCAWCDGPIPQTTYKLSAPRVYCSRECDIARRRKRDYYAEETEHLLSFGVSPAQVCEQLGMQPASLARALHREGRHDLAAPIERLRLPRRKPGKCATCGGVTSEMRRVRCYPCGIAARDKENAS